MDEHTLLALMHQADSDYVRWYSGPTNMALMQPLLSHFMHTLRAWAGADAQQPRVSLRFAHDVVVYPLAAALGVLHGSTLQWPGYASRILFELVDFPRSSSPDLFVRVLFEGKTVQPAIPACNGTTCTLRALEQHVQSLLGEHADWDAMCKGTGLPDVLGAVE